MTTLASETAAASIAIGPMVTPTQQYRVALVRDAEGLKLSFEAVDGFETRVLSLLASRTVTASSKRGVFSLEIHCGSCVMVLHFLSAAVQHRWLALLAPPRPPPTNATATPVSVLAQDPTHSSYAESRTSIELKPLLQTHSADGANFAKRSQSLDTPVTAMLFQEPQAAISLPDDSGQAAHSIFDARDDFHFEWDIGQNPHELLLVKSKQQAVQAPEYKPPKRESSESTKTRTADEDWDELLALFAAEATIDAEEPRRHSTDDKITTTTTTTLLPADDPGLRRHSDEPRKAGWARRATLL